MPDDDSNETEPRVADGDFEYDEAHDSTTGAGADVTDTAARERRPTVHPHVQMHDDGGDYGYDLAHDLRPR
jgi:hypothetical protein